MNRFTRREVLARLCGLPVVAGVVAACVRHKPVETGGDVSAENGVDAIDAGVWNVGVLPVGDSGPSDILLGDMVFINTVTGELSKRHRSSTQRFFGTALNEGRVVAGRIAIAVIPVKVKWYWRTGNDQELRGWLDGEA